MKTVYPMLAGALLLAVGYYFGSANTPTKETITIVPQVVFKDVEKIKIVYKDRTFVINECKEPEDDSTELAKAVRKNRIKALAGVGPTGNISIGSKNGGTTITKEKGLVGGINYDRLITERISVGAEIHTNGTILGGIGLDF